MPFPSTPINQLPLISRHCVSLPIPTGSSWIVNLNHQTCRWVLPLRCSTPQLRRMEPRCGDWLAEDLDFFGADAFPHGFYETFPSPSKLDKSWWTNSSLDNDYYKIVPRNPYFQIVYLEKLLFIIIKLQFHNPVKPYFPIKTTVHTILYTEIDALDN